MPRFTPEELYEIFSVVDQDGQLDCPIFASFIEESTGISKCLALSEEDKKAMQQALRLAKRALAQEIAEIEDLCTQSLSHPDLIDQRENKKDELNSKLYRLMRNYIQ